MTKSEKRVWEAAFAAEYSRQRVWRWKHGMDEDKISGFSCAEVADACVIALREALHDENAKYLEAHKFIEVSP